jgi:uncharacterized protein YecE (DUF72 family)
MSRIVKNSVLIGTCGFAEAQDRTFHDFEILEVQQTFYQPPGISTAKRWRQKAPADFVFTVKAWQLITHRAGSPTYRKLKEKLSKEELAQAGDFRWNEVTYAAWEQTLAIAQSLWAEAVLFQTPKSFSPTKENLRQLTQFFDHIRRKGQMLVFEPRGEGWTDHLLFKLSADCGLVPGIDPFLRPPLMENFRLHGRPAYRYHHRYTDEELKKLVAMIGNRGTTRVLFNNVFMAEDARRLMKLLGKQA